MKRIFTLLIVFTSGLFYAQTNGITYQAVIYNPAGEILPGNNNLNAVLANQDICLRFSIKDAATNLEYQETQKVKTDEFGMVNVIIGQGDRVSGYATNFDAIIWNSTTKKLQVEMDITGNCSVFIEVSNQNFSAVPFAYASKTAENVSGIVAIANGGTGASTVSGAKTNLGLNNVDNTSDANKPISTATQTALDTKAPLASPALTGIPTVPTAANGTNTTQIANTAFVQSAIAAAVTPDATTTTKGKLKLTGDLGGTADVPTVPGLATKEPILAAGTTAQYYRGDKTWQTLNKTAVGLGNVDNTSDASKPVSTATQTALNAKEDSANKSTNISLGTSDVLFPTQNAVKTYVDNQIATTTIPDATTSTKGKIKLAGDLGGTADLPTVPGLTTKENAANKSTNTSLGASDVLFPTQNAVKTYVDNQVSSGVVDATTITKGKIKLAGDLAGTADAPTVPGLANKENTITAGTTTQYYRGDKSWQTLDKTAVGLGNVDNTSDASKPVSTATQTALNNKENTANKSTTTTLGTSDVLFPTQNAVKTYVDTQITTNVTPDATTTSLGKIQLTGDLGGTATNPTVPGLASKEPVITAGATTQYYRGDKTWQTLNKTVVGLNNVDNTTDANKPISTATLMALNLKEDSTNKSTAITLGTSDVLFPTQNAVKTYVDNQITSISNTDASTTSKGKIRLGGDLAGTGTTAAAPVISDAAITTVKVATSAITTNKIADNAITNAKLGEIVSVNKGGSGSDMSNAGAGYIKQATSGANFTTVAKIPVADVDGAVRKVNGVVPDTDGNVAVIIGRVFTGATVDPNLATSIINASPAKKSSDIYVVADGSNPNNGRTFIYDGTTWLEVATNLSTTDARYVNVAGDTMEGDLTVPTGKKLILTDAPNNLTDAANKNYVDSLVAGKQNTITLTTTGTGAASLVGATLNIPTPNNGTVTNVDALTIGTSGTDITSTVANATTTPVVTLNVPTASATNRGALSAADWTTFNSKVGGSGTTNYVPKFLGTSPSNTLTNSSIFDDGAKVGIGTASPTTVLSVQGSANVDNANTNDGTLNSNSLLFGNGTGEGIGSTRIDGSPNKFGINFFTNSAIRMALTSTGKLGLGTTSPFTPLSNTSSNIFGSDGQGVNGFSWSTGVSGYTAAIYNSVNTAAYNGLAVKVANNAATTYAFDVSRGTAQAAAGTPLFDVLGNGNVGIGTASPASKLDVSAGITSVNSAINATGSINDFLQYNIQNTSSGTQAQSGYSATADNGNATSGFAWLGINNSGFNYPTAYNIGGANDVSFVGSGQDMYLANANNTKSIIFSTGKATTPFFNEQMRILNNGNVGIGTATPTNKLEITQGTAGNSGLRFTNLTASSSATTSSNKVLGVDSNGDVILTNIPGTQNIVNFSTATPTTSGVVFTPNTSADQSVVYQSAIDNSLWTYNGSTYVTYTAPASTAWNLANTTNDAGSNKTSTIYRTGNVAIGTNNPTGNFEVNGSSTQTTVNILNSNASGRVLTKFKAASGGDFDFRVYSNGYSETLFGQSMSGKATWMGFSDLLLGTVTTNPMIFGTNGIERMRILSDGRIGIGTTSPISSLTNAPSGTNFVGSNSAIQSTTGISWLTNAAGYNTSLYNSNNVVGSNGLQVKVANNSNQTYALEVGQNTTQTGISTPLFNVLGNGFIGVGTNAPVSSFANTATAIQGSNTTNAFNGGLTWSTAGTGFAGSFYSQPSNGNGLQVKIAGNTSANNALEVSSGATQTGSLTPLFNVLGNGNVGVGTSSPLTKLIVNDNAYISNIPTTTANLMDNSTFRPLTRFQTTSGVNNNAISHYLTTTVAATQSHNYSTGASLPYVLQPAGGNVGIGTTAPTTNLDVVGGFSLRNAVGSAGSNYGIEFNTNSTSPRIDWVYNGNYTGSFAGDSDFYFRLQNSKQGSGGFRFTTNPSGSAVERLTILNNGNIGIGITNPTALLEISSTSSNGVAPKLRLTNGFVGGKKWELQSGIAGISDASFGIYNVTDNLQVLTAKATGEVGIGTSSPDASAKLDLTATNKGFLPPRVSLTGTADVSTIATPATGLLVYNTATTGTAPAAVQPGYYYYNGSRWVSLAIPGGASVNVQAGAYTLTENDSKGVVIINSATAVNVTVPATLPAGFFCQIIQKGAGAVTVSGATGVTIQSANGLTTRAQFSSIGLMMESSATGYVSGDSGL